MKRVLGITVILAGLTGCASISPPGASGASISLPDATARTLGLSSSDVVTISNEFGGGIVGRKYYTATTKNGDEYNCYIFSSMGFSNPPECIKKASIVRNEQVRNEQVRDVQKYLNKLGYPCGSPDGIMGKKTREAIEIFQVNNDLLVNGQVTAGLLKQLQQAAD